MDIKIVKALQLPEQIADLARLAEQEKNNIIEKLVAEFAAGSNCFADMHEHFVLAFDADLLIGCGGLNQQRNEQGIEARIGRIRRFYVHPQYRQHGVGKQMLAFLEQLAKPHYAALCLQTDTRLAAQFYQKQNYVAVEANPDYNYFKYLI